jgi:hypothetical protein
MMWPGVWQTVQTVTGTCSLSMRGFYPLALQRSIRPKYRLQPYGLELGGFARIAPK